MGTKKKVPTTRSGRRINMRLVRAAARRRGESCYHIGNFLFQFSQLEFSMRAALAGRLNLDNGLFDIVTSPYNFGVLCTVMKKVITKKHPEKRNEVEKLYKECHALNEKRVLVAHGMWTEGDKGLIARVVARNSLEAKFHFEDPEELKQMADKAQQLMQRVIGFQGKS